MAEIGNLDFDCPQYVNFAELSDLSEKDVFFDCKDHQSPEDETPVKNMPTNTKGQSKYPSEEESRLVEKMTAALSVLENTPKLKMNTVKGKLLTEKFSKTAYKRPVLKTELVPKPMPLSAVPRLRSKSVVCLNEIIKGNQKPRAPRKRSSSLNDLRTHKKQQTYPMTPMCLKRTIIKARGKVMKTTEEMELEKIAVLQQQLRKHLRHNEMTLKRLKLKPRPCVSSKNTHATTENGNKGLNPCLEKTNVIEKNARRDLKTLSHAAVRNEAVKVEKIIKSQPTALKSFVKVLKDEDEKIMPLTISSTVGTEVNAKDKFQLTKKPVAGMKYGFHSGLVFHDNIKKSTTIQPFSFVSKNRENITSTGVVQKSEASTLKHKVEDGKENIPDDKSQTSLQKTKGTQSIKGDFVKEVARNKKLFDRHRLTNRMKGLHLSENIARN